MLIVSKFFKSENSWQTFHPPPFLSFIFVHLFSVCVLSSYCKLPHCGPLRMNGNWLFVVTFHKPQRTDKAEICHDGYLYSTHKICAHMHVHSSSLFGRVRKLPQRSHYQQLWAIVKPSLSSPYGLLFRVHFPKVNNFLLQSNIYSLEENT